MGDGNFHGTPRSRSSGWTSLWEGGWEEQSLGAVVLTEMMACKQCRAGVLGFASGCLVIRPHLLPEGLSPGTFSPGRLQFSFSLGSPWFPTCL